MWDIELKSSYLQHRYNHSGTVKVQIRIRGTLVLCMWCLSPLEICRASSQNLVWLWFKSIVECLHLFCVFVGKVYLALVPSHLPHLRLEFDGVWWICRRTCGCCTRTGSYWVIGRYCGSNEEHTPGNCLWVLHFGCGWYHQVVRPARSIRTRIIIITKSERCALYFHAIDREFSFS
jgi:hypothetical protein